MIDGPQNILSTSARGRFCIFPYDSCVHSRTGFWEEPNPATPGPDGPEGEDLEMRVRKWVLISGESGEVDSERLDDDADSYRALLPTSDSVDIS